MIEWLIHLGAYDIGQLPSRANGEQVFVEMCPFYLIYRSPAIADACRAYEWREKNSLQLLYPNGVSTRLVHAVTALSRGITSGQNARLKERSKPDNQENYG